RARLLARLEPEAQELLDQKMANYPASLDGRTVVIEFARGGPADKGAALPPPLGYFSSLPLLAPAILDRAAILYIWVTPEESRRKNRERTDPKDPGSILNHGVPEQVMRDDYGCDDFEYLMNSAGIADAVRIPAYG